MKKNTRAFIGYNKRGQIIPGSLITTTGNLPNKGMIWKEVATNFCCETTSTEPLIMEILPWDLGDYEFAFGMRVASGNKVKGTIDWGDGSSEPFDLTNDSGTVYIYHVYSTNQFTPQTVKVYFNSVVGFENLEIGQGDLTGDLLSVSNLQAVFGASNILEVDADGQDNLTSINVSNLPIQNFYALDCATLHYVNVSGCTNLIDTELFEDDIYELDFTGCTSLESATIFLNANLSTVIIEGCPNLIYLDAGDCALSEDVVNNILITLDNNGLENGEVYLQNGTSSAPTGAGATAASNLMAKGWTVSTN